MSEELETAGYELRLEDHDALTRFLAKSRPPVKLGLGGTIGAVAVVVVLTVALVASRALDWPGSEFDSKSVWLGVAIPVMLVVAALVYLRRANRRALRDLFTEPCNRW